MAGPAAAQDYFDDILQFLDLPDDPNIVDDVGGPAPPPAPLAEEHDVHQHAQVDDCSLLFSNDLIMDMSILDNSGNGGFSVIPTDGGVPPPPPPYVVQGDALNCSGCQVLREVVHTNGFQDMKLSIHGGPGVFYHATLDVYQKYSGGLTMTPALMQQSHIDLRRQDYECVKRYLTEYALLRVRDNVVLLRDSLSAFYDALCTNLNHNVHTGINAGDPLGNSGVHVPSSGPSQPCTNIDEHKVLPIIKSAIALQRERTGRLQLADITGYFHWPINEAAKELDIGATALKRICRKYGIARWPHRKLKSVDKKIASLMRQVTGAKPDDGTATSSEIERLKYLRSKICTGLA